MQLIIIIILGRGSAPPQTPPRTYNNYKKNESVTNDSLSPLRNLRWIDERKLKRKNVVRPTEQLTRDDGRPIYYCAETAKSHS